MSIISEIYDRNRKEVDAIGNVSALNPVTGLVGAVPFIKDPGRLDPTRASGPLSFMTAEQRAARAARKDSASAADKQAAITLEMFYKNIALQEPYMQIGLDALPAFGGYQSSFTPSALPEFSMQDMPFLDELEAIEREEGERGVTRALSAAGISKAGKGFSVMGDFQRKLGSQQSQRRYGYGVDAYNRALQQSLIRDETGRYADTTAYNRLLNRVNIGRGAATQIGSSGLTTGANLANIYGAGAARDAQLRLTGAQAQANMGYNLLNTGIAAASAYAGYAGGQGVGGQQPGAVAPRPQPLPQPQGGGGSLPYYGNQRRYINT